MDLVLANLPPDNTVVQSVVRATKSLAAWLGGSNKHNATTLSTKPAGRTGYTNVFGTNLGSRLVSRKFVVFILPLFRA